MKKAKQIAVIDLFCGVGGLTHGLKRSGLNVVAGVDVDANCQFAYEYNNKATFLSKDIRKITAAELSAMYPKSSIRVLAGCAPCQPFSTHTLKNRQRHLNDSWNLLSSFSRIVSELRPDIVSMENVPQLARQRVFKKFLNALERSGYRYKYKVVCCSQFGVPQSRRRLILLASRLGEIELPSGSLKKIRTVRSVIARLPPVKAGASALRDPLHMAATLSDLNMRRILHSTPGGTWRDWPAALRAACHRKATGTKYPAVYSRMEWDKPAPTITTQFFTFGTGRFGHPKQHRALTLREGALLQTFPRWYRFVARNKNIKMSKVAKHIGNAVPVRLGEVIGTTILEHCKTSRQSRGRSDVQYMSGKAAKRTRNTKKYRGE